MADPHVKPASMPTRPELPECISIIVCDDLYRDERTKKLVIVGTFNQIHGTSFPFAYPGKLCVLLSLTNGRGEFELSISVEHAATEKPVLEIKGNMKIENPMSVVDVDTQLRGVTFPVPGKYWIVACADGERIGQRPIVVAQPSERGSNDA